jgi:CarD family transcriptional regulator
MNLEHQSLGFDSVDRIPEARAAISVQSSDNPTETADNCLGFRTGEFVVYPAHGVGQISAIEVQTVAGASLEFFVIYFAKSKMRLRVPTRKAAGVGMRKPSSPAATQQVRRILSQVVPKARSNWSRLVKEYETKIKSGDITALAEAVRDLCRRSANAEQSYSERQLYTAALDRLSEEVALVESITEEKAALEFETLLMNRLGRTR